MVFANQVIFPNLNEAPSQESLVSCTGHYHCFYMVPELPTEVFRTLWTVGYARCSGSWRHYPEHRSFVGHFSALRPGSPKEVVSGLLVSPSVPPVDPARPQAVGFHGPPRQCPIPPRARRGGHDGIRVFRARVGRGVRFGRAAPSYRSPIRNLQQGRRQPSNSETCWKVLVYRFPLYVEGPVFVGWSPRSHMSREAKRRTSEMAGWSWTLRVIPTSGAFGEKA